MSKINHDNYCYMCDRSICLVGLDRLEKIVGLDQLLDKIIITSEIGNLIKYAQAFEGANNFYAVKILEDEVVNRGNSMHIYHFALKINCSNKEQLAIALISLQDAVYIRIMSQK